MTIDVPGPAAPPRVARPMGRADGRRGPRSVRRRRHAAHAAVVATALLWGGSGPLTDAVLDSGFGPLELAFWRLLIGGSIFAVHAQRRGGLRVGRSGDLLPLAALGVVVLAGHHAAFGLALEHGGVSLVNLFIALAPGLIAAGAYLWFRERLTARTVLLVAVGVTGLVLAAAGGAAGVIVTPASICFGVVTTLTVVAYTLGTKPLLDRYTPAAVSALVMLIGAAALLPFVRLESRPLSAWLGVLVLGLGATYLAHLLYLRGLEVLGATTTGLLVSLETPVALVLAAVLLGERFTTAGLLGVALVVASSVVVIIAPVGRRNVPPPVVATTST